MLAIKIIMPLIVILKNRRFTLVFGGRILYFTIAGAVPDGVNATPFTTRLLYYLAAAGSTIGVAFTHPLHSPSSGGSCYPIWDQSQMGYQRVQLLGL